ncbi:MAG TPA: heme-copper oxidase subunit III, partial [Pyrinomonadaceae bacterium]|nr:heme-copper oxidase subunit III [Pyrinomonadaceae bacterium]
ERVKQKTRVGVGGTPPGRNGRNGKGPGGGGDGGKKRDGAQRFSPKPYRVTLWILIAAIFMMFAAMIAAYVNLSQGEKWPPLKTPRLLWLSTGLILASSLTFEAARRSLKAGSDKGYVRWLLPTLLFGLGFLASQVFAWRELVAQGVYLATNNHSSFFYLLTGAHAVHLVVGILALVYLLLRTRRRRAETNAELRRRAAAGVVSVYWHFMDGLWLLLFLLLFVWK